jgi:hypothetical protein
MLKNNLLRISAYALILISSTALIAMQRQLQPASQQKTVCKNGVCKRVPRNQPLQAAQPKQVPATTPKQAPATTPKQVATTSAVIATQTPAVIKQQPVPATTTQGVTYTGLKTQSGAPQIAGESVFKTLLKSQKGSMYYEPSAAPTSTTKTTPQPAATSTVLPTQTPAVTKQQPVSTQTTTGTKTPPPVPPRTDIQPVAKPAAKIPIIQESEPPLYWNITNDTGTPITVSAKHGEKNIEIAPGETKKVYHAPKYYEFTVKSSKGEKTYERIGLFNISITE